MGAVCCKSRLDKVDAEPKKSKCVEQRPRGLEAFEAGGSFTESAETIEARLKTSPKWKRGATVRDVYKIGKTLGTGGFAVVKLVTHRKSLEQFACKIMCLPDAEAEIGENENSRADVFREIEILCGMEHENVMCMKEFYTEKDRVYLITELLTGGELLDAVVERGIYSEADACLCFKQLVSGIAYLHSKGVVHRDLKLENLLLASPDDITHIKIVDFGLAKMNGRRGCKMGTVCGTPQYVAPEIIESAESYSTYDKAVDMWSAGVVLFILLGGYPPFHHDNESVMFEQIRHGKFKFDEKVWDTISSAAKDLIQKLLNTNPVSRYTAEDCLGHAWFSTPPSKLRLRITSENLKKNHRKQFRKAVNVVLTINKMKRLAISEEDSAKLSEEAIA